MQLKAFQNIRLESNFGVLSTVLFAGLTGLGALLVIPLPFTPVPITGQTLMVLLSGLVLGRKYGTLSQLLYLSLGLVGLPWFAGGASGLGVLLGATGGYLVGFVVAAYITGYLTDLSRDLRSPRALLYVAALGTVIIYICGILGILLLTTLDLWTSLQVGFFPFIPGDLLKVVVAFAVASLVLPQETSSVDTGLNSTRRGLVFGLALAVSITTVTVFVWYLLSAGPVPPVHLVAFSLLTSMVVVPSLLMVIPGRFLGS